MRNIILYTAVSLDGFIAGPKDKIDWLFSDQDYGYQSFYNSVDTLLWGHTTWKLAQTLEGFSVDNQKDNIVFSHRDHPSGNPQVRYICKDIPAFVKDLKNRQGMDIWLVGGGQINSLLLAEDLIDRMVLSYHPVVLGTGKPLFLNSSLPRHFQTRQVEQFDSGLVQLWLNRSDDQ